MTFPFSRYLQTYNAFLRPILTNQSYRYCRFFIGLSFSARYFRMFHSLDPLDLTGRLAQNHAACRKKLEEDQRQALWARQAFANQCPHTDSDPKTITREEHLSEADALIAADGFDKKISAEPMERGMRTREKTNSHGTSEEDNPFEEEENLELTGGNPILDEILRHTDDPRSPGNRYCEGTRRWAFELLRMCESKALSIVRKQIPVPPRQSLSAHPPSGYFHSDLTDFSFVAERVCIWRHSLRGTIEYNNQPRCILARDALAYRPNVEVTGHRLKGLDVSDFNFEDRLFESLPSSRKPFLDFVKTHWDQVLHAAFVF
jgi:hypothetical protein